MSSSNNLARIEISSAGELRSWLADNHTQDESIWLVTWKKHNAARYVSRDEVLDELVSFGWIDGVRRKLDDDRTMQLVSPRRTQYWAKSYKDRAARLIAENRMAEAGLASIESGKNSGLWDFMDDVDALIVPDDLAAALAATSDAAERFDSLAPSYRRNVLRWIKLAKTPATRAKRIERTAHTTARGERIPQM